MRIEPKDFQDNAVLRLTERDHRVGARRKFETGTAAGRRLLSSPTG